MYRNIIVLFWWITIIIIFKVTTNFEFKNGMSILFVLLMIVFPLVLYIFTSIHKRKLMKKKLAKKLSYFSRIKKDYNSKIFQNELIKPLNVLLGDVELGYDDNLIEIKNRYFKIEFVKNKALIYINDTKVIYQYFYTNRFDNLSSFDVKFIQYKDSIYLYKLLREKIESIFKDSLLYKESSKGYILSSIDEKIIYYQKRIHNSKKEKYQINKIIEINKN